MATKTLTASALYTKLSGNKQWNSDANPGKASQGWYNNNWGTKSAIGLISLNGSLSDMSASQITKIKMTVKYTGGASAKKVIKFYTGAGASGTTVPTAAQLTAGSALGSYTTSVNAYGGNSETITLSSSSNSSLFSALVNRLTAGYTYFCTYNGETSANSYTNYSNNYVNITALSMTVTYTTYSITYNENGGSAVADKTGIKVGDSVTIGTSTRTGYTFVRWTTNSNGSDDGYNWTGWNGTWGKWNGSYGISDFKLTLYAVWAANKYNLNVRLDGGTWNGSASDQTFSLDYGSTKSMTIPTKTGYIFGGWGWTTYGTMNNSWANSVLSNSTTSTTEIGVYNNSNNGSVTHTYVSGTSDKGKYDDDHIKIQKSSTAASPGLGGFRRTIAAEYNTTYYHTFYAKLPTGYYFTYHYNPLPTGTTLEWLTSNQGTGKWEIYAYKVVTGSSGTKGAFGYIAANASAGSSQSVTWYLGANQITKNPNTAQKFTVTAGNTWMYPLWIPKRITVQYNKNDDSGSTATQIFTYNVSNQKFGYENGTEKWPPTEGSYADLYGFGQWYRLGYKIIGWDDPDRDKSVDYTLYSDVVNSWIDEKYDIMTSKSKSVVELNAVWDYNGTVRIYDGSTWRMAIPYINTDGTSTGWKMALPYVNEDGTSTGWTLCGG